MDNDAIRAGDCFKIVKLDPYLLSKQVYTGSNFYVPFPADIDYSLNSGARPVGEITRVDDFTL